MRLFAFWHDGAGAVRFWIASHLWEAVPGAAFAGARSLAVEPCVGALQGEHKMVSLSRRHALDVVALASALQDAGEARMPDDALVFLIELRRHCDVV